MKQKSNICDKCSNKVACALGEHGTSKYFLENKNLLEFHYSIDLSEDTIVFLAQDNDKIMAKQTIHFANIKSDEDMNILSRAVPFVTLRCIKYLAVKRLRKEGVNLEIVKQ